MPIHSPLQPEFSALLAANPALLEYFQDSTFDGTFFWDLTQPDHRWISEKLWVLLGYNPDEIAHLPKAWKQVIHPDDIELTTKALQAHLSVEGSIYELQVRYIHKDGSILNILCRGLAINNKQGKPYRLIGVYTNLTEILKTQTCLKEQMLLIQKYLDSTSAIMIALDTSGNVVMLNQKGQETLGISESEIVGKKWFSLGFLPAEITESFEELYGNFIAGKIALDTPLDHEIITRDQSYKMFTWINTLLRDEFGKVTGSLSTAIDITERSILEKQLQQSESQLIQAHKLAQIGHYTFDFIADKWTVSAEINIMLGISNTYPNQIEGWLKLIHPDSQEAVRNYFLDVVAKQKHIFNIQYQAINQTTFKTLWVASKGKIKYDDAGKMLEIFGTLQNISEQKTIESKLILAGNAYDNTSEGIMVADRRGNIIDVNQAFTTITGYSKDEIIGQNPRALSSGVHTPAFYQAMWKAIESEGKWQGEIWNRKKDGNVFPEFITINTISDADGQVQYYLALFSDMTKQKDDELKLKNMTHFDSLTGLPNRVLFSKRLSKAIGQADLEKKRISLAFIDLDGFKQVNDALGHALGDKVLKIISSRYRKVAREHDTVARISGDEFVILLNNVKNNEAVFKIIRKLLSVTSQPITIDGHTLSITCSIGVTHYPQKTVVDSGQLIRQADNAMYQAKVLGKNKYHVFDNQKDLLARAHHQEILAMEKAIEQNELVLYYQPKMDMRTNRTIGLEALVRWQHPKKGLLQPLSFLPAIERQPVSVSLDKWVIERAFQQACEWSKQDIYYPISVNVGAPILQSDQLIDFLKKMLATYTDVPANLIELEVLETSALEDIQHVSQLIQECENLDIKVAIDDFGTGYSSLEYLKSLPASYLKIDQSFVRDMLDDEGDLAILKAIIGLAKAFGMETIAEGVETDKHCKRLVELGCYIGQGYGIAKPMPTENIENWLKN